MDGLAALLDGPRARGAFVLRSAMRAPWSLRVRDRAPLTVVAMVRGGAWIAPAESAPERLGAGDVAVMRGPDEYAVADDLATPAQVEILPGQVCTTAGGQEISGMGDLGVRTWGNDREGADVLLTGTYAMDGDVSAPLLRALPAMAVLRAGDWNSGLVPLLADEVRRDAPGQEAVLDRLVDVLLIAALRAWFTRPGADAPGWYRGYADPVVGPALRLLHNSPDQPWTVASLARAANVSRATLARRFREVVGESPMAFLTGWRIALAADLLAEPGATLGSVAGRVGFGSPFALSAAFTRVRGISPREHRARLRSA